MGSDWVHLRLCLSCGHVGCCDSSPNKHATKHFKVTEHPIIRSFEPGEDWEWCYVDQVMVRWNQWNILSIWSPRFLKKLVCSKSMKYVRRRQCELRNFREVHLVRLWRPPLGPGEWPSIGLFKAANEADLHKILDSLPLHIWMKVTITPLTPHPNDPKNRVSQAMDISLA